MTEFLTYHPPPPLSDYVHIFWYSNGLQSPHEKERVLPDGSIELVINLREDIIKLYDKETHDHFTSYQGSIISGPHSDFVVIDTASQTNTVGIHFKPGGAFPFFPVAIYELWNTHLSLEQLWGDKVKALRERLLEARSPTFMFHILEQFLIKMKKDTTNHPIITYALAKFQTPEYPLRISDITDQINLSPRHFIDIFKKEVGLTPKQFWRVQRFQHILSSIHKVDSIDWMDIALACGYYDQAHFIHDFRSFSGIKPTAYQSNQDFKNHVPLF